MKEGTGRMAQNTQTSNPVSPNATPGSARRTSLSAPAPKLCDLIREKEEKKEVYYSFEFFPPKTEQGMQNLYSRFDLMSQYRPLFIDVTWGAGGRTSELTIDLCINAKAYCHLEPQMHLTCTNMPLSQIDQALEQCKENGIRNILALRGGYPEKHVDADSYEDDLKHLKAKIDAGADLIITQLFYDPYIFLKFVKDCRDLGINVPVLPGLMPLRSYDGLVRMCELCGSTVPKKILDDLKGFKDDDKQVQDYGVLQMVEMCKVLIENGVCGLHFYTLNQERSVTRILLGLGLLNPDALVKPLPWTGARSKDKLLVEDVRPIYWANRPKTYISRTRDWDEFPNGRWGDPGSPSFSTLDIYHLNLYRVSTEKRLSEWGSPKNIGDVAGVFVSYLNGKVSALPWNNTILATEANVIFNQLKMINNHGFLTINSQPNVNACQSDHPIHGWGPLGGFVWQKAYIEFFCSPQHLENLKNLLPKYPSLQLQAMSKNRQGDSFSTFNTVTAVTWGVWPGSEIKQPTIVDPEIFSIWKDEAFALWSSEWSDLYPRDHDSYKTIEEIANTFYLVNIVDNDFISGDIFRIFNEIIETETLILAEIEETKKEKVKLLEAKLQELEGEKKKLAEERKAFEAEKAAFAQAKGSA